MSSHPSFLELDQLSLGVAPPSVDAHVQGCAQCRGHLDSLKVVGPIPASLQVRARTARAPRRAGWSRFLWLPALAAVVLAVLLVPRGPDDATGTRPKAMPTVALYIKRGEQVTLWDGASPIRPGDTLRLKLHPEGFRHGLVLSVPDVGGTAQVLWQGQLGPEDAVVLPEAWRVDEHSSSEHLRVLLSDERLDPSKLPPPSHALWNTELRLPKTFLE